MKPTRWLHERATFQQLPIDDLVANPVQPEPRATDSAVQILQESMLESKLIAPIIVTRLRSGKYMVIDGHRRLVAARKHALETVPCMIVDVPDPEIMFVVLGKGVRKVSSYDWFAVWAKIDAD